ncbi:MAG: alpha/beta hydrolase [Candidatus Binatus sp.]|uniref:alpha/beta hydrolase n=1 Tax=Candidatus Binatus sp. TaxID=2811406 RepID=UPI0027208AD7|nr:alpha/beta hydrolase [Candidatus Binatus sp.]MDO8432169.1 alpha/beta hydrolase [Candidatus Binatus sp.]
MLTPQEQDIIRRWNDFYLKPRPGSIQEQRKRLVDYFEEFNTNQPAVGAYHEGVQLKAGLTADIAVPHGSGPFPVVIYIHGGAWTLGSPATHRKLIKQFAEAGYLTIAPDYRLAPENPFPAGLDDCVFTAHWVAENAHRYNGVASRMAMGGDSAGGNLTAATLSSLASSERAPKFKAAILIYGAFDFAGLVAVAKEAAEPLAKAYLASNYPAGLNDPRVSPIRAIKPGAMPPSFIIAGAADGIVGESRTIAEAMNRAGIENELRILDEMPHAFMQMTELSACREGHRLMFDFLRRHV